MKCRDLVDVVQPRAARTPQEPKRFNSNGELVVQGGVNVVSAFVGGLPGSGVSSHMLDNARLGAQTPIAGILQAVFLVVFLLLVEPLMVWRLAV